MTKKEIFEAVKNNLSDNCTIHYELIENRINNVYKRFYTLSEKDKEAIKAIISSIRKKWQNAKRTYDVFVKYNNQWLDTSFCFVGGECDSNDDGLIGASTSTNDVQQTGRPVLPFKDSSDRTKRRKTEEIREKYSHEELGFATQMSLRAEGKSNAAKIVKDVTLGSPSKTTRYRKSFEKQPEKVFSNDEALALLIDNNLSKSQYCGIRCANRDKNPKLYPPYNEIVNAKKNCYPNESDIFLSEMKAEVNLQALLNLTIERILLSQTNFSANFSSNEVNNLHLISKWGCDGTSGQSRYKQVFKDDDGKKTDENIFFASLVPLQLTFLDKTNNEQVIIWKNPRPSSARFCRPILIEFLRESVETTKQIVDKIQKQEKNLQPYSKIIYEKNIHATFTIVLTMIDGKVCNSLTDTSSTLRCYLCECTSKEFNNIDKILKTKINEDHLQFGISSLHAWIRFFECLLHLSYKLGLKKWQARGDNEKQIVESRKKEIQKEFRLKLGLLVDQPKQGYGSTNDGNTARRFFQNSSISSQITGIDENLIKRFHVILQTISCGLDINISKFEEYAIATARQFVQLYPWYNMPTSIHKILIHGHRIIEQSLLPIGQMSEEAQESCNKVIKKTRQDFARKCSRIKTMEDIFLRLFIKSDPVISAISNSYSLNQKKNKPLSTEAMDLLDISIEEKLEQADNYISDCDDQSSESE